MDNRERLSVLPAVVFGTAFLEGASVLVVEIAGARVLAPYYGASLQVWTSQITATLLFLALGYLGGGWLSRRFKGWFLSALFAGAGLWLCLLPFVRNALLNGTAHSMGVALGSFTSASVLYGLPLAAFGAVSPVLIEHWNRVKPGAGSAAGLVYFVNTLGGLAGAWLTAHVLIPQYSMRVSILAVGIVLVAIGGAWYFLLARRGAAAPLAALLIAAALAAASPRPLRAFHSGSTPVQVVYSSQTSVGLVQVLEMPDSVSLIINGITQGGVDRREGYSRYEFTEYLNVLSHGYLPEAKKALLLGMGSGALARQLAARGLDVTVVELEPKIVEAARRWFGLPSEVKVVIGDGRAALRRVEGKFDLVYLDVFAGESVPWYMVTHEGLSALKEKLEPGGVLMANTVTTPSGSPGLERLEAALLSVFKQVEVYVEPESRVSNDLVNASLAAGDRLEKHLGLAFTGKINPAFWDKVGKLRANGRPARAGSKVSTDDSSDMDLIEAPLRARWREMVVDVMDAALLAD